MTVETLPAPVDGAALAEQVVIKGDLSKLTEQQRMGYYSEVCRSLGLNPFTRPFEYIVLNGKMTLYATRAAGDQLRSIRGITITGLEPKQIGELYVVVATGRDRSGREDSSTGAVHIKGLTGEALANAMMKAETKAKRRLTLSLAGLGFSDESEVGSIPNAQLVDVDPATGEIRKPPTLAERAASRAAEVAVVMVSAPPERPETSDPTPAAAEIPAKAERAARAGLCGAGSDPELGAIEHCAMAAGHEGKFHRSVDADGVVTATWPTA
ncbi:MAG: hypothetical protein ACYDCI_05685 [Candidatus Limnocylindrales bacterium]